MGGGHEVSCNLEWLCILVSIQSCKERKGDAPVRAALQLSC